MTSYAVVWQSEPEDNVYYGRLELDQHGFALHGRNSTQRSREYIRDSELAQVSRSDQARIGSSRTLRVLTRDGRSLLITTLIGVGMLSELLEALAARVTLVS